MVSVLISLLTAAFAAVGKLFEFLYARQLVDAGRTQQQLEQLSNEVKQAQIAVAAREAVRASIVRSPDSLPEHDPFLRD